MVFISAVLFSLGGLLTKLIPWAGFSISSGRCIFSSLFFAIYFLIARKKVVMNGTTVFGAVMVCLNMTFFIFCNKMTTAANTIILEYVAPIYIIIFKMIFSHRKPKRYEAIISASVLLGIVLVLSGDIGRGDMFGNALALLNGVVYAMVIMLNEFRDGDSLSSMLMGHVMCIFLGLPSLLGESDLSLQTIAAVALFGIFVTGGGFFFLSVGTKYCDSLSAAIIACVEPILNPLFVLIFYGEKVSSLTLVGASIVIASIVIYNLIMKRRHISA